MKEQIIYGRHPIVEAIKEGKNFEKILLQEGTTGEFEKELRQLSREYNIPIKITPKERLNLLARNGNHQGVLGFVAMLNYYRLDDVLPMLFEREDSSPLILILDGVTDVRNLGAIARSAECAGAGALVVPHKGSALINAEAIKTSAGALTRLPVCREHSLVNVVEFLQQSGVQVLASTIETSHKLADMDFSLPTAIILGSEDEGVQHALLKRANHKFGIPQLGKGNSFNVSVAAGIILYESMVQRTK